MVSVIRGNDNFDSAVGGSTTYGAVGTYVMAYGALSAGYSAGDTVAGSTLSRVVVGAGYDRGGYNMYNASSGSFSNVALSLTSPDTTTSLGLSGTWRAMTNGGLGRTGYYQGHLWLRVS